MTAIGLLSIVLVVGAFLVVGLLGRLWTLEVAFVRVSWVPLAALVVEGVLFWPLSRALSYFAVAIPVLTCIVSLLLTFVGATLVLAAGQRQEHHPGLLRATLVASVPGALLIVYVLYAFVAYVVEGGP